MDKRIVPNPMKLLFIVLVLAFSSNALAQFCPDLQNNQQAPDGWTLNYNYEFAIPTGPKHFESASYSFNIYRSAGIVTCIYLAENTQWSEQNLILTSRSFYSRPTSGNWFYSPFLDVAGPWCDGPNPSSCPFGNN